MPESFFALPLNRVAVVLIDFQNDFCSPEVSGDGPVTNTNNAAAALRANAFAQEAASLGARVVYTQQVLDLERLTERQRRWERADGLCAAGSWGAELFIPPVAGSEVIVKDRFDSWQSAAFEEFLTAEDIDGLVICGVELVCCVLYAILGASERGYHYVVPPDLVSGQDFGDETDNRAVRDYLRFNRPDRLVPSAEILARWRVRSRSSSSRG
ncbi:isochorismatase family cysteine hydrolase [Kribbella sp. NPDC051952]|uniref:cysteine hydrolase family protein n=1 Tax=Kribbella sp. NPDC051952 TaxID=3154851 RepID=UPI00341EEFA4